MFRLRCLGNTRICAGRNAAQLGTDTIMSTSLPALERPPIRSCAFGPIMVDYDARVLTPRDWTLGQSEWAAELARGFDVAGRMLELCAGAGHIGLAAAVLA